MLPQDEFGIDEFMEWAVPMGLIAFIFFMVILAIMEGKPNDAITIVELL